MASETVLIIEDDDSMRILERRILESSGYEVLEADNGKTGTTLAIKEKPDLILMDIRLPSKKRGIGAARIIRSTEETKDIPIIFVTCYTKGEETSEVSNISKCGYLTKPFEIPDFISKIKEYLP